MLKRLPKIATVFGVLGIIVGLGWGFVEASDIPYKYFSDYWSRFIDIHAGLFLITLPAGILLSFGGTVAWARQLASRTRLRLSGAVFAVALAAFIGAPNNVHGPGMLLVLTAICAGILSLVLALMGIFR